MKKRIISLLLSAIMLFSLLPVTAMAGDGIAYIERSWNGSEVTASEKTCTNCSVVSSNSKTWTAGWYVVNTNTTISSAITVSGDVHLILYDNVTLTAQKGVIVNGNGTNSLTIYGQSGDSGKLITTGSSSDPYGAGIGGGGGGYTTGDLKCGTVTIHGGTVNATGSEKGAGIGGGVGGAGGTVTIYGGKVTGTAPEYGAGIGGGMNGAGGTVTIYGGEVTANGHNAGIDGGNNTVTIFGGTIKATSNDGGSIRGKVTVNGGAVTAISNGGTEGTGIGGDALTVNGGTVTATGKNYGAGISSSAVTVNAGNLTATGGEWGPGISGDVSFGEDFVGGVLAGASEDEAVNMTKQAYTEDHSAHYVTMPVRQHTTHDDIEFQPWVPAEHDGATLPTEAGSWYLPGDVTLYTENYTVDVSWTVPVGVTNLCLNSKMLSLLSGKIIIPAGATLNLYDCGSEAHTGYLKNHFWSPGTSEESGTTKKAVNGGCIYASGVVSHPIMIKPNGTLNMYGGTVTGYTNNMDFSSVITGDTGTKTGGWFNMYGGAITGNSTGARFAQTLATVKNQGIVRLEYLTGVTVGKDAVIDENYVYYWNTATASNVYEEVNLVAPAGKTFTLGTGDYAPTEKMHVGVRSVTAPALGTPVVFTGANAGENDASRFESNMEGVHVERRKNNALYLCVEDETAYVPHECVDYKEKQNGQAATCTADGWKDYYKCTTCETLYSDEAMTNEITDLEAWKADGGKLGKTGHDWTYSANENVVTATCKNNVAHTATLTLTAASQTYTNIAVEASFEDTSAWTSFGLELPTIAYEAKTGSSLTDGNAINAGSYTAKASVTIGGQTYTATKDFEISKATLPTELAVSLTGWTYGETNNDPSVTGNVGNGAATYTYKVKGTDDSTYTETKPVNAGSYTVRASIAETTNYEAATVEADFTIDKADMVVGTNLLAPSVPIPLVYDGNAQELLCAGQTWDEKDDTTSFGTFYYSVDGTSWSTDLPTAINAGEYNPVWYFVGDENHNNIGSAEEPITQLYPIEIARGDQTVATVVMDGYTYGGTLPEPSISITPSENATVTYYYSATDTTTGGTEWKNMTATTLDAGTYYLYAVIAATDNFGSQTTAAVAFTIAQKEIEIDWAEVDFTYDGTDQTSKITASYKDNANTPRNLVVEVNEVFQDAGDYTATVRFDTGNDTGSKNYALPETKTQTYTMNTKALTATVSATKVYDGTAAATADQVTATVATGITGETLTISGVTGTFNSANVADCATVTPDGTSMSVTAGVNTLAANYTVSLPESGTGSITAFDLSTATVTVDPNGYDYTGSEVKPTPTVTFDTAGKLAIPTDDYTLSYENNTNAAASTLETGAPTVTVEPADSNTNVTGSKSVKFTILKVDQPAAVADTASVTTGKSVALESNISGKKESPAVTYAIDGTDLGCTVDASTGLFTAGTEAGDVKVNVTFAATTNYKETVKTITVTVSLRTEVAVSGVSMVYPGEQSNYVYGDTVTKTGTPSAKIAGTETPVTSGIDSWTYTYYKNTGTAEAPNWTSLGDTAPSAAGSYKLVVSVPEANEDYIGSSEDIPFTIAKKVITITPNANQKKTYGENDPAFSYQNTALCGEDTLSGALSRAVGETYDASGYAFALGTLAVDPAANADNYTLTLSASAPVFMIEKKVVVVSDIVVADKVYDGKNDGVVIIGYTLKGKKTEDTLTLTGITGTYTNSDVNAAQTVTLNAASEWTLGGTAKDNYVLAAAGQPTTAIGKITKAAQAAPTAPTVSGSTVTVAAADRTKKLEYCVDDNETDSKKAWISVPTLNNGAFTLSGLAAGNHTVYLRVKESSNYNASASAHTDFELTQFSVAYNANGGVGTIASQTATAPATLTVAGGSAMKRTGYTFNGWNTKADGTGTAYAAGSTISDGATLYAQWTANGYTVKFNANGGSGTMESMSFTYDAAQKLSQNLFTHAGSGYHFVGWATSANGPVLYADEQSVVNLAGSGTVTLYAIWAQEVYTVKVNITSPQAGSVQVKLQQGNAVYAGPENVTMTGNGSSFGGSYSFTYIPVGTYNLVAKQTVTGDPNVTMTQLVVLTDNTEVDIVLPASGVNSELDVKENTLPTVVGGLDAEAESNREIGKDITVTMTVEKKEEQQLAATASEVDKATQDAISEIKATANSKKLDFMDIAIKKTTVIDGGGSTTEAITETSKVLELVFSYEMNGKKNIKIYREHGGTVQPFTELTAKPTTGYEDGTFWVDTANSLIYVYAKQFSTYAIGYEEEQSEYHGGGSGSSSYTIIVNDAKNGTVSADEKTASAGSTVTITVAPEKGFTLETLTVLDKNGKEIEVKNLGNNKFSFKMPSGNVSISATFMEDNTMLNFFVDVKATDYFYDAVLWAAENGITKGTDAVHFSPYVPVTRAQVVTFLWRTAGCPEPAGDASKFTDVVIGSYYEKAVAWAIEQGITKGTSDTTFSPDKVCTRAQIVTFLARFAGVKDEDTGYTHGFTDVKATDYFNNAVAWAKDNKVTEGTSATTFSPNTNCTRAQVVTFLYRWMVK